MLVWVDSKTVFVPSRPQTVHLFALGTSLLIFRYDSLFVVWVPSAVQLAFVAKLGHKG